MTQRFIALDRDGVINEDSDQYIKKPSEWQPIPGSIDGIAKLTQAGFRIAVVSNQSGLGRGLFDLSALNAIHNRLRDCLAMSGGRVEMILFCPHAPWEKCACRKPLAGLLDELSRRLGIPLAGLPFVGDSITDIEAGRQVGMDPILVRSGKGQKTLAEFPERLEGVRVFRDLKQLANNLIASGKL